MTEANAERCDPTRRYVFIGWDHQMESWRRDNEVPLRNVVHIRPDDRFGDQRLRGLTIGEEPPNLLLVVAEQPHQDTLAAIRSRRRPQW